MRFIEGDREDPDPWGRSPDPAPPPSSGDGYGGVIPERQPDPVPEVPDLGSFELPPFEGGGVPNFDFGPAPDFVPPEFMAPSMEDAMNEPGYQFRADQGNQALERSAAARGVLRTGGTLKDLLEYGQNFAAQEYNNVFNRSLQAYGARYRAAYDAYAPRLMEWQSRFGAGQEGAMAAFNQRYNVWAQMQQAMLERERLALAAAQQPPPTPPEATY